jgi:hypothetical protein
LSHALRWKLTVEGTAEFQTKINSTSGLEGQHGMYTCYGWSADHPPKAICKLDDLAAAHDQFNTSTGTKLEAVLSCYGDIGDYADAKEKYFTTHPDAPGYTPFSEVNEAWRQCMHQGLHRLCPAPSCLVLASTAAAMHCQRCSPISNQVSF